MISLAADMERIQQREPRRTFAKERRENAAGCEASAVSISAVDPVLPEMLVFIEVLWRPSQGKEKKQRCTRKSGETKAASGISSTARR